MSIADQHRRYIKEAKTQVVKHSYILQLTDFSYERLMASKNYILQGRWATFETKRTRDKMLAAYRKEMQKLQPIFQSDTPVEEKRKLLILKVEYLQTVYQTEFPEHGWYDVQVAVLKVVATKNIVSSRKVPKVPKG